MDAELIQKVYNVSTLEVLRWYENTPQKKKKNWNQIHTHKVGQKKVNGYGLFDMSGNVLEWCWDWYSKEVEGGENPLGATSGSFRVRRGGSWYDNADYSSVVFRYSDDPYYRGLLNLGFRVCRSVQ